ncbi:MAG: hypothetical protein EHM50_00500 [Lysobacterales bacterium]|nr:MAG: hypothetical protein EHM50_00500 [Xanthomonadales bacterium]
MQDFITVCEYAEFNHSFLAAGSESYDVVLAPAIPVPARRCASTLAISLRTAPTRNQGVSCDRLMDRAALLCSCTALVVLAGCSPPDGRLPHVGFRDETVRINQALELAEDAFGNEEETLELLALTESYSEALLLARVSAGAFSETPPELPNELTAMENASFTFDSWSVPLSESVTSYLHDAREERNAGLNAMDDDEWSEYEADAQSEYSALRAVLSDAVGWEYNVGDVLEAPDGSLWRRAPSPDEGEAPSSGAAGGVVGGVGEDSTECENLEETEECSVVGPDFPDELRAPTPRLGQIIGNDTRELRSAFNGFQLNSSVWGPKMLLMSLNGSTNPSNGKIDVSCSGVKISERIIITAAHCLFENGSWTDTRRFVPAADGVGMGTGAISDPSPHGTDTSQWRYIRGPWEDHEWDNYDFGLMVLWNASSLRCWWWHAWEENVSGLTGDTVFHFGFPGETQDCSGAGSPMTDGDCWASIYGDGGDVVSEGGYRFYTTIDDQSGQSGAPVYKIIGGTRVVYGIAAHDFGCCENDAVRLNDGNSDLILNAQGDNPASSCG